MKIKSFKVKIKSFPMKIKTLHVKIRHVRENENFFSRKCELYVFIVLVNRKL